MARAAGGDALQRPVDRTGTDRYGQRHRSGYPASVRVGAVLRRVSGDVTSMRNLDGSDRSMAASPARQSSGP